jgi:type I restriction enzyme S subunit
MTFPTYPSYKSASSTTIGRIPSHWKLVPLRHICEVLQTGPFGSQLKSDSYIDGGVPVVNPSHITDKGLEIDPCCTVTTDDAERLAVHKLKDGDIVVGRRGEMGRCAVVPAHADGWLCGTGSLKARLFGAAVPAFVAQYIKTSHVREALSLESVGSTMENLNSAILGRIPTPLPPVEEQRSIVAFLDRETARIDALIAEQERLLELLAEKRQAVISHAVTKGLNADAPMKDLGVAWLGEVPAHWRLPPLSVRYESLLGKMLDSAKITGNSLVPYLRNVDVQWGKVNLDDLPLIDITEQDYERFTVRDGDLLVCEGGEVGRAAIVRVGTAIIGFQKALHRLRALSPEEHPPYLFYTFSWAAKAGAFGGEGQATIAHLTGEQLRRYRFPTPPFTEQVEIASHLDEVCSRFDRTSEQVFSALALLRERRAALIAAAVTGQIDVREAA